MDTSVVTHNLNKKDILKDFDHNHIFLVNGNLHSSNFEFEDKNNLNFKNNIYLATISRVEPSLQAAFVNFGRDRHGFLAFNDIQSDYYQLPSEDKEKIRIAEEKIREDLKEKTIETNQENLQSENNAENKEEKNDENQNIGLKQLKTIWILMELSIFSKFIFHDLIVLPGATHHQHEEKQRNANPTFLTKI